MLCHECKKREATVHIIKISGSQKTQIDLCPVCAEKYHKDMKNKITLSLDGKSLLQAILQDPQKFGVMFSHAVDEKVCKTCGTSGKNIRKTGLAGCPDCYETFAEEFESVIDRVQRGHVHVGYVPKGMMESIEQKKQLKIWQKELEAMIRDEAYEKAAELRDRIRSLEDHHA